MDEQIIKDMIDVLLEDSSIMKLEVRDRTVNILKDYWAERIACVVSASDIFSLANRLYINISTEEGLLILQGMKTELDHLNYAHFTDIATYRMTTHLQEQR